MSGPGNSSGAAVFGGYFIENGYEKWERSIANLTIDSFLRENGSDGD